MSDYSNWSELAEIYGADTTMALWDDAGIPYTGKFLATLSHPDGDLETIVLWPDRRLALCDADKLTSTARFELLGWRFVDVNTEPKEILEALNEGE